MSWPRSVPASAAESALDPLGVPAPGPQRGPFDDPDRWERRGELAAGGMGVVTVVHDRWLGRDIAVKVPSGEQDTARLLREARITAGLDHPGIVSVFDAGRGPDGTPWFAMRLVRGRSLADTFSELAPDAPTTPLVRHVLAAAEAVAYAHSRGVIHRDIKPANIMVGPFGETQVIDWGLALDGQDHVDGARSGTPASMSPEQARREPIDQRADVYALGLILFELAARRPPFSIDLSRAAILEALAADRVPTLPPDAPVPAELRAIIARATHPTPAGRYPDAKALADDLLRYLDGRRVAAHAYTARELFTRLVRVWRVPILLSAIALVLIGVILAIAFSEIAQERDASERTLGRALVDHARAALHADDRGTAEILALEALSRGDFPEARGVLLASPSARPARAELPAPACAVADLAWPAAPEAAPLALCLEPERLSVHRGARMLWQRRLATRGAVFVDHGAVVVAQLDGYRVERFDAATGDSLGVSTVPCAYAQLWPAPDTRFALVQHHSCAAALGGATTTVLPVDACAGFLRIGATSNDHRLFAGDCGDGSLVVAPLDPARAAEVRKVAAGLNVAPARPLSTALAVIDPETVIVGDSDGGVSLVDLAAPLAHRRLVPHASLVRRVLVSADGRRALVRYEDGPVHLLDLPRFNALGQLPPRPDVGYHAVGFTPDGGVWATSADGIERWDFDAVQVRELRFPEGVVDLAVSSDGRTLAVAHGAVLSIVDAAARAVVTTRSWQSELVRALAFAPGAGPEPRLVAGTLGENGLRLFSGHAVTSLPLDRLIRKVVALGPETFLAADFNRRLLVFTPNAPPGPGPELLAEDHDASPDGRHLALLDTAQQVWVASDWSADRPLTLVGTVIGARRVARCDAASVFALDRDGVSELAAAANASPRLRYDSDGSELGELVVSPSVIAAGARDGSVHLWRRGHPRAFAVILDHARRVDELAIAPDGTWLAAADWDGRMLFIETAPARSADLAQAERAWGLTLSRLVPGDPR